MIRKLLTPIQTSLESIDWVDNYQGLVRLVQENTREGINTHMVACGAGATCYDQDGKLKSVTPDDAYKCFAAVENQQGIRFSSLFRSRQPIEITAPVTFSFWLNLKKMGVTDCDTVDKAMNEVVAKLASIDDTQGDMSLYRLLDFQVIPNDSGIFSQYSSWRDNWSVYPFQYFTLQFTISTQVKFSCLDFISQGNEIDC